MKKNIGLGLLILVLSVSWLYRPTGQHAVAAAQGDQWYAVVDAAGNLVSSGTVLGSPLPPGRTAIPIPKPIDGTVWSAATRAFVPAPVVIDPDKAAIALLLAKDPATWTPADTANALRIILKKIQP